MKEQTLSIWYLIGQLLVIYGILIGGMGFYHLFYPPPQHLILTNLHADLWWGILILILGVFYTLKFRPSKQTNN